MEQWLRLHVSNTGGTGLIPDQGTKIPYAAWHGQKKKKSKISLSCLDDGYMGVHYASHSNFVYV